MEGIRKSLQITLENCEFAKEFHYFLTVQLDGEGEKVFRNMFYFIIEKNRCFCRCYKPSLLC